MQVAEILAHLQSQFGGRMVLYVGDIAVLLGNSKKAVEHLIARKNLPFTVKMVGGRRCVDIFQVAHWLAREPELTDEVAQQVASAPARPDRGARQSASQQSPSQQSAPAVPDKALELTPMAQKIIKMRSGNSGSMERFVHGLRDADEFVFMQEVLEEMFFSTSLLGSSYVVTVRKLAPKGFKLRCTQTSQYFDTQERARLFLLGLLYRADKARSKHVRHFLMAHAEQTLFHAVHGSNKWTFLDNTIDLGPPFGG